MVRRSTSFLILICLAGQSSELLPKTTDPYLHGRVPSVEPTPSFEVEEDKQKTMLLVSAADIIHSSNHMLWQTGWIRQQSDQCASFEIGFVFKTMEDTYRKMLDLYNTTVQMRKRNSEMEHVLHLEKIEVLHWEIYHYHNMMHEIERKYKMDAIINGSGIFDNGVRWTPARTTSPPTWSFAWKRTTSWWRPLVYGWNTDYYNWD